MPVATQVLRQRQLFRRDTVISGYLPKPAFGTNVTQRPSESQRQMARYLQTQDPINLTRSTETKLLQLVESWRDDTTRVLTGTCSDAKHRMTRERGINTAVYSYLLIRSPLRRSRDQSARFVHFHRHPIDLAPWTTTDVNIIADFSPKSAGTECHDLLRNFFSRL